MSVTALGIFVITGGTTGIGAEVRRLLLEEGHEVFNIDYTGGDFEAAFSWGIIRAKSMPRSRLRRLVNNSTQSIRTMELVIVLEQVITQQPFLLARRWRRPSAM